MLVFQDPSSFEHDPGPGHPERIGRLAGVARALETLGLAAQSPATMGWDDRPRLLRAIHAVHSPALLDRLERACRSGAAFVDTPDCAICEKTHEAALGSAACALAAVESVATGRSTAAFSASRPPGHHCERDRAMGFCFVNNAAVASNWLIDHGHARRVAIVDFDVHHGNGTQHIFERRADVLYASIHQHPATLYPGTGYEWERGPAGTAAFGTTVNCPLDPGSGPDDAIDALDAVIVPAVERFGPDFIVVSAGFDADGRDPLANLAWDADTYGRITQRLNALARALTGGRVVTLLEGGYDEGALAQGLAAHLGVLMDMDAR